MVNDLPHNRGGSLQISDDDYLVGYCNITANDMFRYRELHGLHESKLPFKVTVTLKQMPRAMLTHTCLLDS